MQTQETKLTYGMKGKLISAVAMLLVAIIMVVSSTYAWFTLSTAPEVTGISTAVGANGALEMLLLTKEGDELIYREGVIDTRYDINTYWGNLVDVSTKDGQNYGLDNIVLYPSQLSTETEGIIDAGIVKFPVYGADGRVSELSPNAVTGIYETINGTAAFYPGTGYGVRAVGSSSGMTARQLAYRNALSSAGTNMAQAQKTAANALSANGNAIADIAIRKATADEGTDGEYTQKDLKSLVTLTTALNSVVKQMEESYKQYIIAIAASSLIDATGDDAEALKESFYTNVEDWFKVEGNTIYNFATDFTPAEGITLSVPEKVTNGIAALKITEGKVSASHKGLSDLYDAKAPETDAVAWDKFSEYLYDLVDVEGIKVCGLAAKDIVANKDTFASTVIAQMSSGGLVIEITTGGGVLADVADQCGNYDAKIVIPEVDYIVSIKDVPARMYAVTDTDITGCDDTYLGDIKPIASNKSPANTGATKMPISEFYGYIIDLAFRTNAAESNLLLQTAPKDRIYSDNAENELTWGKGSTMTFKSTTAAFTDKDVTDLMQHVKIVFFTPDGATGNEILAYAKLDITDVKVDAVEGVTANIYLYKTVSATKITGCEYTTDGENPATVTDATLYRVEELADDGVNTTVTYYKEDLCTKVTGVTEGTPDAAAANVDVILKDSDAVIRGLVQNTAAHVSVLVYLDGSTITNADVAATAAQSMTGSMNLQFASSAPLVPMDYAEYQTQNNNQGGTQNP